MKKVIVLIALILFSMQVFALEEEQSLFITLTYDLNTDSFTLNDVELVNLPANVVSEKEGYELVVPETNYSYKFNIPNVIYKDYPPEMLFNEKGEQVYFPTAEEVIEIINPVTFKLQVPYSEKVTQLMILSPEGKEKLKINLQKKEELEKVGKETEAEKEIIEKEKGIIELIKENSLIFVLILIIIILSGYYYYRKKRLKKKKK